MRPSPAMSWISASASWRCCAPENPPETAEKALIDDRLRMFAARQFGITPDGGADRRRPDRIRRPRQYGRRTVRGGAGQAGVDRQTFRDFVTAGVIWRQVVRQHLLGQVRVTDAEVAQEMVKIIETPQVTHVAPVRADHPRARRPAGRGHGPRRRGRGRDEIRRRFPAGFARKYSATPSAANGGRLPWTPLANLPPGAAALILSMKPGQISQPLTVPGAVVLFYLRDTRGTLRPGAEAQVLDYVRFTVGTAQEAARIAAAIRTAVRTFSSMPRPAAAADRASEPAAGPGADRRCDPAGGAGRQRDDRRQLWRRGALLMLCKREPALMAESAPPPGRDQRRKREEPPKPDPNVLPARDEVRNEIFNRKVGQAADAYLAELRANAVIRRPLTPAAVAAGRFAPGPQRIFGHERSW